MCLIWISLLASYCMQCILSILLLLNKQVLIMVLMVGLEDAYLRAHLEWLGRSRAQES